MLKQSLPEQTAEPGSMFDDFYSVHLTGDALNEAHKAAIAGNLELFVWDSAVKSRMRDFAPQTIAIDSMNPGWAEATAGGKLEMSDRNRSNVWFRMPGHVEDITDKKKIRVVAGDFTESALESYSHIPEYALTATVFGVSAAGVAYLMSARQEPSSQQEVMSRRRFLSDTSKVVAGAGILGAVGSGGVLGAVRHFMSFGGSRRAANIAEQVDAWSPFASPVFGEDKVLDGRNALLKLKLGEARVGRYATLLGDLHNHGMKRIGDEKDSQAGLVIGLAQVTYERERDAMDQFAYDLPRIPTDQLAQDIRRRLSAVSILEVADPNPRIVKGDGPAMALRDAITPVDHYQSPVIAEMLNGWQPK